MADVFFDRQGVDFSTPVSNRFLSEGLQAASGTYVKVYLYVYYCFYNNLPTQSLASVASQLNVMEADVTEALMYWQKEGYLSLIKTANGSLNIRFTNGSGSPDPKGPNGGLPAEAPALCEGATESFSDAPHYTKDELSLYMQNEPVRALFAAAEGIMGRPLNINDRGTVFSFYDYYRLPIDVIYYVMSYCFDNGYRNLSYIEKLVQNWAQNGIFTMADAKAWVAEENSYVSILKYFNVTGRRPSEKERSFMRGWIHVLGSSPELIHEAASRTLNNTGRASLAYANAILSSWNEAGLTTLDAVLAYEADKLKQAACGGQKTPSGSFHSLSVSGTDYDRFGEETQSFRINK